MLKPIIIGAAVLYAVVAIGLIALALMIWAMATDDDERDDAVRILRASPVWPFIALKMIRDMLERGKHGDH